jgi:hypothetical protein
VWERASVTASGGRAAGRRRAGAGGASAAALLLVAGFGVSGALLREDSEWASLPSGVFPLFAAGWMTLMLAPLAWLLGSKRLAADFAARSPGRLAYAPILLVFPALVFFHGMSPYLGLRTVPAFSMFSNLRTEGGLTNHWFMPGRALRIAGFQEDLVTVRSAEDEELIRFARRPRRTFYDFKMRIQRMAASGKHDIVVSYRRGSEVRTLARAEADPELMQPVPWWQRAAEVPAPVARQLPVPGGSPSGRRAFRLPPRRSRARDA